MVRALHRSVTKLLMAGLAVACIAAASAIASPQKQQHRTSGHVLTWQNGHYLIDGKRKFIVAWVATPCPSPQEIDRAIAIGINVIESSSFTCDSDPHQMLRGRAYWVDLASSKDPNTSGETPELLNVQNGLRTGSSGPLDFPVGDTPAYARCNQSSTVPQYNQAKSHHGSGLYGLIMMSQITASWSNCIDAQHFEASFWTAIAAHQAGLNFMLQSNDGTSNAPLFDPAPGLETSSKQAMKKFERVEQCVVNGTKLPAAASRKTVAVAAWKYNGSTCMIAVNTTPSSTGVTFTLPANASPKALSAVGGGHSLRMTGGKYASHLGELEEGVYIGK
jgi:hypothetical protein